jgi:hypothetical protein
MASWVVGIDRPDVGQGRHRDIAGTIVARRDEQTKVSSARPDQ